MADRNEYLEGPQWYVAHTYSGYENKVKTNIDKSIQNLHLEEQILDVQVPIEVVIEVKDGKERPVRRKLFPGYVYVYMIMNDETWYVVRNTRGVTGFVGPESKPVPLSEEERLAVGLEYGKDEGEAVANEKILVGIEEGDVVRVDLEGFKDTEGIVRAINSEEGTVDVGIDGFGRETIITVDFLDIRKKK